MPVRPNDYKRGNIYLSGGMQFAKNLGASWREKCSAELLKMQYFPLDITELDVAYNDKFGALQLPSSQDNALLYKANIRKHFVETDLKLIQDDSDALIVYYDESARRGAGTVSEAQYAFNLNIPIFLVCEYPTEEAMFKDVSSWLVALCTKHFLSFDALYEYLDKLPPGILHKNRYGNHGVDGQYLCHLSGEVFQKKKNQFVSEVRPLYSKESVEMVRHTHENIQDRYDFFMDYLTEKTNKNFKKD